MTENRGVPGSSPGLAITRNAAWLLDLSVYGALNVIRIWAWDEA
jgi:hypothetical protein